VWGAPGGGGGAVLVLWSEQVHCMRDILILNKIWVQGKGSVDRHFAYLKYFTFRLVKVPVPNCKQHSLSPAKVRKCVIH
jgi:hypothetical protein